MKIETLEKANKIKTELEKCKNTLKEFDLRLYLCYEFSMYETTLRKLLELDDELKEIIKEHLIAKKERLEKELEEL